MRGRCDVAGCNSPAEWKCVDSGMLYCSKHRVKHRLSDDMPYHTFVRYQRNVNKE